MSGLLEQLRVPTILNYIRQLPEEAYLGTELFPAKYINELSYKYMVGANNLPVAANVISFNAEAPVHSRDGGMLKEGRIPAVKRKVQIDEETLLKLYMPRANTSEFDDAIRDIYDDVALMVNSVRAGLEVLRMKALTEGKIEITDEETYIRLTADYGLDAKQKVTCDGKGANSKQWGTAGCTILADIQAWADTVEDLCGVRPSRAVTSRKVLNIMLADQGVKDAVWNQASTKRPITEADLSALMERMDLPQIAVYEKKVRLQGAGGTKTTTRLFPEDKFVMLPGDNLGETLFAPTAEALRAVRTNLINFGDARGIFGEVWETNEPPAHWTKAAALSFPSFPRANEIMIATVLAE